MPQIIHKKDPAGLLKSVDYHVENGTNLFQWLTSEFEDQNELCGNLACDFILNGKVIFSNDNDEHSESQLDITLSGMDTVFIVNRPAGDIGNIVGVVFPFWGASVIAAQSVVNYITPTVPSVTVGSADNTQTESPNNSLNAAKNTFRPFSAIPECFGFGVSYPDFIQPSYYYYDGNRRIQIGVFCITAGSIEANPTVRVGDTDISTIANSSATIYGPGVSIPPDFLRIYEKSTEFESQTLVAPNDGSIENDGWVGWFELPSTRGTEQVQFNIVYPSGIRNIDNNGNSQNATLQILMQIQSLNDAGNPTATFEQYYTLTLNTLDPQYRSIYFNPATNPGMTIGKYRARVKRTTNIVNSKGNSAELIKVESVTSVSPTYSDERFGDCTKMVVKRKATLNSADQSGQKINLDYRRLLPYYNRATGEIENDNLVATDSFADAVVYTLRKGGESVETIGLQELYSIYDGLSDSRLGGFTFTFDDADVSMGERVETICNSARVNAARGGSSWTFVRDEIKQTRVALFNRRSLSGSGAKQSWTPQRKDDADSIRITYIDPKTNTEAYIKRRYDLDTLQIVDDELGESTKEIKLYGCRNQYQAANRADLEIRRLAYQRRVVSDTTYQDAMYLDLMDRVGWVDINDTDVFDGEIVDYDSANQYYYTSEPFFPEEGETYLVFITDDEGYPSNTVICTPLDDTEFGFFADGISAGVYIADQQDAQIGSRYFIAKSSDNLASNFLLSSRTPNSDGTVDISLVEYNADMYEKDDQKSAEGGVSIANNFYSSDYALSGNTASASLLIKNDGSLILNGKTSTWYTDGIVQNIGDQFEVYVTVSGESLSAGITDQWIKLDSDLTYTLERSADGVSESDLTVKIREINYTANSGSNTVELLTVVNEPVTMPTTITDSNTIETTATSTVTFSNDGTWQTIDGDSGVWVSSHPLIGSLYELRATNLSGNAVGTFDSWVALDSNASFTLTSSVGEISTFDIEIRAIDDISNTGSVSVTLYSATPVQMSISSTINVTEEDDTTTPVISSLTFSSDGEWLSSQGAYEVFASPYLPQGDRFELRATNLTGDTPTGTFDSWVKIDSNVVYELSTSTSASCSFDVEIREIYNTSNSITTSATLSAEYTGV